MTYKKQLVPQDAAADAIQFFEECEADVFLKQAKEALAVLR